MGSATYQTIKLSTGKHHSPDEGACVMELASMLADERFSDQPASVCPVIGSFLRAYNDSIDDRRRQDLYAYAAKVVGSRVGKDVQRARAEHLIAWARQLRHRSWHRLLPRRLRSLSWMPELDVIGPQVVRAMPTHNDQSHSQVLTIIDELLSMGADDEAPAGAGAREPITGLGPAGRDADPVRGAAQPTPPR
jgi:hypothetical protein